MPFVIAQALPKHRWLLLQLGVITLLSVYYVNYGGDFSEGTVENIGPFAIVLRIVAVAIIFGALAPRMRAHSTWLLVGLYGLFAVSYMLAGAFAGEYNDRLFLNTLIQIPMLFALTQSRWTVDFPRLLRFVGLVLTVQIAIDTLIWQLGDSLWLSQAYVGGTGNPSSFGIECAFMLAFYLLHPAAGKRAFLMALLMLFGVVMTKSLFAVLAVTITLLLWAIRRPRRLVLVFGALIAIVVAVSSSHSAADAGGDLSFLIHKISAAGAFVGLWEYDTSSARSVSAREEMHEQTFRVLFEDPLHFLTGHLRDFAYWPMDSQMLTYLGSFGGIALFCFLALHILWTVYGYGCRRSDGGFSWLMLMLFLGIFFTNRILDYFPIASLYFLTIAMATRGRASLGQTVVHPSVRSQIVMDRVR